MARWLNQPPKRDCRSLRRARNADRGFDNFSADLTMILRNKQGQESKRALRIKVLEVAGDGNKILFVFDNPRDVKGTAFLIHGHITGSGRPVAVPSGAQEGQANQFVKPFRILHGERVRL